MVRMSRADYAIAARGIKKFYGKLSVLKGIDFNVERGTIMALLATYMFRNRSKR